LQTDGQFHHDKQNGRYQDSQQGGHNGMPPEGFCAEEKCQS
jgi:hypothetical protein